MPPYMLFDHKSKKVVAIYLTVTAFLFVLGIVIGYFSHTFTVNDDAEPPPSAPVQTSSNTPDALLGSCNTAQTKNDAKWDMYVKRFAERHEKQVCVSKPEDCLDFGLPRRYTAYHLNDKSIHIDGKLDEEAWQEVPWTELFVDIRSDVYPAPKYETKMKIRWDDSRLYIGGHVQDDHLWASMDTQDARLHRENAISMIMDVDGTMFNYKQVQINPLGVTNDLMLTKSFYDSTDDVKVKDWHPISKKAVYLDGTLNNPTDYDRYWSFEISFSFRALAASSARANPRVSDGEVWFMQIARTQQQLILQDSKYKRMPKSRSTLWSWQPMDAPVTHIQDRWGLVQFKKDFNDKKFSFPKWHVYKALFDTINAVKKYKAVNAEYTDVVEDLDLPPYLLSGICVKAPNITLSKDKNDDLFTVSIQSTNIQIPLAKGQSDKYVSFETLN